MWDATGAAEEQKTKCFHTEESTGHPGTWTTNGRERASRKTLANTLGSIMWKEEIVFYIVQNKKLTYEHRTPPPPTPALWRSSYITVPSNKQ